MSNILYTMSNKANKVREMNASFSEKSVWVQFVGMALVLGGYFLLAGRMLWAGVELLPAYIPLFIVSVVLMVVLQIAGHLWAALSGRAEAADERDRLIAWRAESRAGWIVASGVIFAITALVLAWQAVWVAHLLLFFLFLAELVKYALQLRYYRRGF